MKQSIHTIIIGAGAAGMMAAAVAGQRGAKVLLIDHAAKIGEKIRISGGGRCNFTNMALDGSDASPFFVSQNPRFVRPAMSAYTAQDFMHILRAHRVRYHEKHKGQLFCDDSAQNIIDVLRVECDKGHVQWRTSCSVTGVRMINDSLGMRFELDTSTAGTWRCANLIIATGGLSIPAIGASGFGYALAEQFKHTIVPTAPALVPLTFAEWSKNGWAELAGLSLPVRISTGEGKKIMSFDEDILFSHKGLTGPAVLQISSYWQANTSIALNIQSDAHLEQLLCDGKLGAKIQLDTALSQLLPNVPKRLLNHILTRPEFEKYAKHKWADVSDKVLRQLAQHFNHWTLMPSGTEGYKKAEVTRGGVSVKELHNGTMASKLCDGLYFVGEVVDVTGWLGGYNFQWAWSSGVAAGRAVSERL
ncbi:NAD(P)/FAD-dependent oxidoreductase [Hydromonas duriensis]|uniref:Flavoprotein n=1 Tax=Hydromonas duriensis TaxID=1527608 RepID=A0A4R6YAY3_9BURK|nr:NAD(P)/FAD-dependent oxidoreductase [Hydromonas duriensis]TDR32752.1 hypothetical protein DFR44_10248 [Hydromonas duriensis]